MPMTTTNNRIVSTATTKIQSPLRETGSGDMVLQQIVVADIRFEPERKGVAQEWYDPDYFVDQNIERHAREKNSRNAEPCRVNQR
jgi:hypothetical protein